MIKRLFILLLLYLILMFAAGCFDNGKLSTDIDLDLTTFSRTMMIAMIDTIYSNPLDYMDKTIKIKGQYLPYYNETSRLSHYVILYDEKSCCSYGFEFIFNDERIYPDDYPKEQADIEIIGVLKNYEDLGQLRCYLAIEDIIQ